MHHAKLNLWVQPGGHADGDPDILAVAIKEAKEESGLPDIRPLSEEIFDIDIHQVPAYKGIAAHLHYDIRFLLQAFGTDHVIPNEESHQLLWVKETLPTQELSVVRMFQKWNSLFQKS